jgi:hypothetical protein
MTRGFILLGAVVLLGACHVPPPVYVIQGPPEKVTVKGPPPEAKLEVPSVAPQEGYAWTPGYWHYGAASAGYEWVEGRWVPERRDYYWHEATYVYVNSIWIYRPPFWRPRVWHDPDLHLFQRGRYHRGRYRHRHYQRGKGQHAKGSGNKPTGSGTTGAPSPLTTTPTGSTKGRAAAPPARTEPSTSGRVSAPPATPDVKQPPLTLTSDHAADSPGAHHAMTRDAHQEANLRRRPEYRGQVEGRPVFGDSSRGKSPSYVTDSTGAIILTNEPGRVRRSRGQEEALRRRDVAEAARANRRMRPEAQPGAGRQIERRRGAGAAAHRGTPNRVDPDRVRRPTPEQRRPHQVRVRRPDPRIERRHHPKPRVERRPQPRIHRPPQPRAHRPEPRIQHRPQPRIQHRPQPRIQHQPRIHHRADPRRNQAAPEPRKRRERAAPAPSPKPERKSEGRRRRR